VHRGIEYWLGTGDLAIHLDLRQRRAFEPFDQHDVGVAEITPRERDRIGLRFRVLEQHPLSR